MYVYWWHVGGLSAVKVGHADDPEQEVGGYCSQFGLSSESLRGYRLESDTDAEWVERHLCRLLEARGFRRIASPSDDEADGLYALGGRPFKDAHDILREAAHHIALAEDSNRRKRQMRGEQLVANEPTASRPEEQQTEQDHVERRPRPRQPAATSSFSTTARRWLYAMGAVLVVCLAAGLRADGLQPAPAWQPTGASLADRHEASVANQPSIVEISATEPQQAKACTLEQLSETLIYASCAGSWARLRWTDRWVFDGGFNEREALDFFHASDVALKGVASPSREPLPPLSEPTVAKPRQPTQSDQSAAIYTPAPPPPQRPQPATPRPVVAPPSQQQPREAPSKPAAPCSVSRPKPGLKVYLVTCPNSWAMIGRTVDLPTGWTVSQGVNATEAVEFFMKSQFAR
jgi:hypothetical protein